MEINLRLLNANSGRTDHLVVSGEPESPLASVVEALEATEPGPLSVRGDQLARDGQLGESALRDGDVVSTDGAAPTATGEVLWELAAVGGPGAGDRWALQEGAYTVGRDTGADVVLGHSSLSPRHLRLMVEKGTGVGIEDLGSHNGTGLDGKAVTKLTLVHPGQLIQAGACLFEVRHPAQADADVSPDGEGGLGFNRPARIRRARKDAKVAFPAPPSERESHGFPWIQVIAPLVLAVGAALAFSRPQMLLFALMSPVMAGANYMSTRKRNTQRGERETGKYGAELKAAESALAQACETQTSEARWDSPDPVAVASTATGPGRRLWERRDGDADALTMRVGLADLPANITITRRGGEHVDPPKLSWVPVTVDLATAGVMGVAGPVPQRRAVARWLLGQLAATRSPRELQIVVLTEADAGGDWEWLRWLPHIRVGERNAPIALVGNDRSSREDRLRELIKLLDARQAAAREHGAAVGSPAVVLVLDGVREMRSLPGVPRLLRDGPESGIYAIGLDADANRLAEEGKAEFLVDGNGPLGELRVDGVPPVGGVLFDQVSASWADEMARGLAPLRDVGGDEEAVIPNAVRFVDLARITLDNVDDIVARWTLGGRSTEALVGASFDGAYSIDLKRDGPHGLVAGTTGSGKSEFLQTMVVSLAVVNKPDAMNFVLVDYKGASAFGECEKLPHTVGMVTNLDGHLTERALASLDAELERREHVLRQLGAADIDTAWERNREAAAKNGMARLVIVIDEFAELVHELPEFVTGLIRIARVGRSLGVHLILATQRPAGVVSSEMRANTGLRVALRMEDKHDSTEVLEAPDAAAILRSTPGRGYVRTGGGGAVVQFQTARVAGRRKGSTAGVAPARVIPVPWNRLPYPLPPAPSTGDGSGAGQAAATDLSALVDSIAAGAEKLQMAEPRRPWLPPLPGTVLLADLPTPTAGEIIPVPYGIEDLPASQAQRPATFDLVGGGHLIVIGAARSGRSTVLRTLATALAQAVSPSDLHIYGLDFGNGALLPLTSLPHCGGITQRTEAERVERLVARLGDEVTRRQSILSRAGYGDVAEQRAAAPPAERLPYLVVLLDRYEGFTGQYPPESNSTVPKDLTRLVREGLGAGLRFVIAGDRSLLNDRLAALVDDKMVLRLSDRNDYRMANLNPKSIPDEMAPGRALKADSGLEVQVALLAEDAAGQAQGEAVRRLAAEAAKRWPAAERANRPFKVDVMPTSIGYDEVAEQAADIRPAGAPLWAAIGVGGDEIAVTGVDLGALGAFTVAGPPKSGRSNTLVALARSVLDGGGEIVAVCPRPTPLADLKGGGVRKIFSGIPSGAELTEVLGAGDAPLVVLVDDADSVARSEADDAVTTAWKAAAPGTLAIVVAGPIEELKSEIKGVCAGARKAKAGVLFSPSSLDGDLIGVRLPRNLAGRAPAGRGVLGLFGETGAVQVPLAT
ncbi:MAG: FtsK/SpoIIIE domain-containing protein [Acidimicrobiia bacterium]